MLVRSLRRSPLSALLLLLLLFYVGWRLRHETPAPAALQEPPPPTVAQPNSAQSHNVEKKTPRIALVTFVTQQRSYLYLSLKNKDHYARRHGYDFIVDYEAHTERAIVFWKYDMAVKLIKSGKYDWIWWLDFDTLVTNTNLEVTDIIDEELKKVPDPEAIDYLFTHDCNGFNAGSFLVRGHERSLKFIYDSWAIHDEAHKRDEQMSEQDSTVKLMKDDPASAARVHVVPQWKLNAFPEEIACYDKDKQVWEHGTFILHFAGAWAHVKGDDPTGQLMDKYEREIIWGDWKQFY